jgi:hypothetical protein
MPENTMPGKVTKPLEKVPEYKESNPGREELVAP